MTYTPDITRYQQLVYGGKTGSVDCTAWGGALCVDAHTRGATKLTGRAIRLASDEPIPDPGSPGLNVGQVDTAIYRLTDGRVNLDTPNAATLTRTMVQDRIKDGRWANVAVNRATLINRGYGGGASFAGKHDITLHARAIDFAPVIGDPLVPRYYPATWDAVLDAMEAVTAGNYLFASFTRDLTPDYRAEVKPKAGTSKKRFARYRLNSTGVIVDYEYAYTGGFSAACTPPKYHSSAIGITGRRLVQLTTGSRKGWWINGAYAEEV